MANHDYLRTHNLAAEHLRIELTAATAELQRLAAAGDQDRRGVTLVRQGGLSVVLTYVRAGVALQEHAAPGAATVQVLDGRVRVRLGEETVEAGAGILVAFDSHVRHTVEALEDSTLLLTLADERK